MFGNDFPSSPKRALTPLPFQTHGLKINWTNESIFSLCPAGPIHAISSSYDITLFPNLTGIKW